MQNQEETLQDLKSNIAKLFNECSKTVIVFENKNFESTILGLIKQESQKSIMLEHYHELYCHCFVTYQRKNCTCVEQYFRKVIDDKKSVQKSEILKFAKSGFAKLFVIINRIAIEESIDKVSQRIKNISVYPKNVKIFIVGQSNIPCPRLLTIKHKQSLMWLRVN